MEHVLGLARWIEDLSDLTLVKASATKRNALRLLAIVRLRASFRTHRR
jgi:hypothetical protein